MTGEGLAVLGVIAAVATAVAFFAAGYAESVGATVTVPAGAVLVALGLIMLVSALAAAAGANQ